MLAVFGIAVAAGMLACVIGATLVAQDRAVARSLEALPPDVRAVRVNWLSVGGQAEPYDSLDARVRSALTPVLGEAPIGTLLVRESTILGSFIGLGAVDGLSRWSVVRSGRQPRPCSPNHCEVLVLRGNSRIPSGAGLRLLPVGRGQLSSSTLFSDAIPPNKNAIVEAGLSPLLQKARRYHQAPAPPLILANGVRALNSSPRLGLFYRTYGWISPITPKRVHPWSIDGLVRRIERMRASIQESSFGFEIRAPVEELTAAGDSTRIAGRRLLLLGGQAAVLVLAFVIVIAARFRRDVDLLRQRLAWAGISRWQIELALMAQFVLLAALGTLVGWAAGTGVVAFAAHRLNEPVGAVLHHSVLSGPGIATAFACLAGALLAVVVASAVPPFRLGGRSLTVLDAAGIGALAAIGIALARGAADADVLLRERGTGAVLLALPALVTIVAAALVARILPPLLRAFSRAMPRRAVTVKLAALQLARNAGLASVGVSFLVLATGFAVFAETYRATLVRGQGDQAAFAVGADVVGREDPARLIPVPDVAAPKLLESLGPGIDAQLAARDSASISGASLVSGITVLGLAPSTIRSLRGWRRDFGPLDPGDLATQLAAAPASLRGVALPRWARELQLRTRIRGTNVAVGVVVEKRDGYFSYIVLGRPSSTVWTTLRARIPNADRGGRVVAIRLDPPIRLEEPGAGSGGAAEGTIELGSLRARARGRNVVVTNYRNWVGTTGLRVRRRFGTLRADLALSTQIKTYLRPRQPTDGHDIRALASADLGALAGPDGRLSLAVAGEPMTLRIIGTARRFPGIQANAFGSGFVVADRNTLVTALNASTPSAGFSNELWVNAQNEPARQRLVRRLTRPPFDLLSLQSRVGLAQTLSDDPIARASMILLRIAAIVGVALAVVALLVGVASDMRDDAKELFELEAQGMTPAELRRHVSTRSALMLAAGLVGGALLGLLLGRLVVRMVALTAASTSPAPPLLLTTHWRFVSVAAAVFICVAAGLVAAATAMGLRGKAVDSIRRRLL